MQLWRNLVPCMLSRWLLVTYIKDIIITTIIIIINIYSACNNARECSITFEIHLVLYNDNNVKTKNNNNRVQL